jgi:trimeric autotransporter adhesin
VAAGDIDGDGRADIIVGAGAGAAPHVRVFSGANLSELASLFAYDPLFTGGVTVAAGDVNGDGRADIVTGAGAGGGPHVRVLSGLDLSELASFFAYDPAFEGGVFVAAGDIDGDGLSDVVTGAGTGGGPHVRVFSGLDLGELASFFAFDPAFGGGLTVATGDIDGDGRVDLILGALDSHIRILSGVDLSELASFSTAPELGAGISVGSIGDPIMGLHFTSPASTAFMVGSAGTFTVTTEGGLGTVTLSATGTLPSGVTFSDAGDGTATLAGTPVPGAAGTYPLTITATHGTRTATQAFTLTVSTGNQPPGFTAGPNQTVAEDAGSQSIANWATAVSPGPADEAGQTLTFIVTANTNPALFSALPAVSSTGTLTYTAAPDAFGLADITIVLRDNGGTANGGVDTSAPRTFRITVTSVNDLPTAVADGHTLDEGGTLSVVAPGVLANDLDPDTPPASRIATLVTGPANAVFFTLNTNGSFTYVHDGSETSIDSFTYRMNDGTTDSNVVTVTLAITLVEDPFGD